MFDFDLSPVELARGATRVYKLPSLGIELTVVPLNEANDDFLAYRLEHAAEFAMTMARTSGPASVRAYREQQAQHAGRLAIRGWSGVRDRAGNEVPYSPEAAVELMSALAEKAPHEFDRIEVFLRNEHHWTLAAVKAAAEKLAGNSFGG